MTDNKLRAAILAEIKRQGDLDVRESGGLGWHSQEGDEIGYDGYLNISDLCRVVRETLKEEK